MGKIVRFLQRKIKTTLERRAKKMTEQTPTEFKKVPSTTTETKGKLAKIYAFLCFFRTYFEVMYVTEAESTTAEYMKEAADLLEEVYTSFFNGESKELNDAELSFIHGLRYSALRFDTRKYWQAEQEKEDGRDPLVMGETEYPTVQCFEDTAQELAFILHGLRGRGLGLARLSLSISKISGLFYFSNLVETFDNDPQFAGKKIPEDYTLNRVADHYFSVAVEEAREARKAKQKEEAKKSAPVAFAWQTNGEFVKVKIVGEEAEKLRKKFTAEHPAKVELQHKEEIDNHNKIMSWVRSDDPAERAQGLRRIVVKPFQEDIIRMFDGMQTVMGFIDDRVKELEKELEKEKAELLKAKIEIDRLDTEEDRADSLQLEREGMIADFDKQIKEERAIRVEIAEANSALRDKIKKLEQENSAAAEQFQTLKEKLAFYENDNRKLTASRRDLLLTLGEATNARNALRRENEQLGETIKVWIDRFEQSKAE